MPRPENDDAVAKLRSDHVIVVVGVAIEAAFALALRRHQHDCIAAARKEIFVGDAVRPASVAVSLAFDIERMGVERRKVIARQQEPKRIGCLSHVKDDLLLVAEATQRNEQRQSVRGLDPFVADVTVEGPLVQPRPGEGRVLAQEVRHIHGWHAHEETPVRPQPVKVANRHGRRVHAPAETPRHIEGRSRASRESRRRRPERSPCRSAGEEVADLSR